MAACRHGGPDRPLFLLAGIMEDGSLLTDGPRIAGGEISEAVEVFAGRAFHLLPLLPVVVEDLPQVAHNPTIVGREKSDVVIITRFGGEARLADGLCHQPVLRRINRTLALRYQPHDRRFDFLPRTPIVVDDAGAIAYCPAIIRAGKDHPLEVDRLQPLWDLDRLPILPVVVEKCAPRAHGPPFLRCGKSPREQLS